MSEIIEDMKESSLPSLPPYIEAFDETNEKYRQLRENIPIITLLSSIEATNKMNSTELRLRRWFKCTKFDEKCFATRNTCQQFLSHLTDKHMDQQLFCLYCHNINDESKDYYKHQDLIDHIRVCHPYRTFQCNLCLYRSISIDHLLIHESSVHSRNFEATINASINKTVVENSNCVKECKIIECTQLTEIPKQDLFYYYNNFKHKRINDELSTNQCLYCNYLDNNKEQLYAHCVAAHPDYPILIYTGINFNDSNDTNDSTDHIKLNIKTSRKRSIEESIRETDVSSNGVIDTYEFDIWTESEDEDIASMLTEDELSSDGEPDNKRIRSEELSTNEDQPIVRSRLSTHDNSIINLSQTQFCVAFCVSALLAVYLSVVILSR